MGSSSVNNNGTVPIVETGSSLQTKCDDKRKRIVCLLVAFALIGLAIGLAVGLSSSTTTTSSSSESMAPVPPPAATATVSPSIVSPSSVPPTIAPNPTITPAGSSSPFPSIATTISPTIFPSPAPSSTDNVAEWLAATVTLEDGIQYETVEQLPHDTSAFTQGLTFAHGRLYESTGQRGQSSVRELDPRTGQVLVRVPMEDSYFGEGMAFLNGQLVQITWTSRKGFVYNATDLSQPPAEFEFDTTNGQGWGITYDGTFLIVSDGSNKLHYWDPNRLGQTLYTVDVTRQSGNPATRLNELEYWRGRVLANVWQTDALLVIHPETGVVEKEYDFSAIWPQSERPWGTDVFNGISVSQDPDILYVTGKNWDRMFKIKLLP